MRESLARTSPHYANRSNASITPPLKEVDTEPSATQGLMFDLEAAAAADRLKLPSLLDIALRIREVLSNRVCDNQRVADLLSTDPSAAAKILKIANSPLCRGVSTIIDLREAVARIGMHTVSELVICFSLKDLFDTSAPRPAMPSKPWWPDC